MEKSNNVIEFRKKSKPVNVNNVEDKDLDYEQDLLEQEVIQKERLSMLKFLEVQSIIGQIAFVEKLWTDFNFSEFEIKQRKSKYYHLISGKNMTYLMNKFNIDKDCNEKLCTITDILEIYKGALKIIDTLYDEDFAPKHTLFDYDKENTLVL